MASHKTLLYLGAFFILFDMAINFPKYSISIFGVILFLIGYFKWKIYSFIMKFIWLCIFIVIIYDIIRIIYRIMLRNRSKSSEKEKEEDNIENTLLYI